MAVVMGSLKRRLAGHRDVDPAIAVEPDDRSVDSGAVARCLQVLAERDRQVLVLTFYAEKTSAEIATDLGVTGTVVRVARHRALGRLRACVDQGARTT